jgi:hypothetical protein
MYEFIYVMCVYHKVYMLGNILILHNFLGLAVIFVQRWQGTSANEALLQEKRPKSAVITLRYLWNNVTVTFATSSGFY